MSSPEDERKPGEEMARAWFGLDRKPVEGRELSGVLFLHFKCDGCGCEHRLRGAAIVGITTLTCSACGIKWEHGRG